MPRLEWSVEKSPGNTREAMAVQGVSVTTLGNIGGLLASIVAFVILVAGYVLISEKRPMRSDYVVYFFIVNVVLFVGIMVSYYYQQDRQITIQ